MVTLSAEAPHHPVCWVGSGHPTIPVGEVWAVVLLYSHPPRPPRGSPPGEQVHPHSAAMLARGAQGQGSCPVAPASVAHPGPSLASSLLRSGTS